MLNAYIGCGEASRRKLAMHIGAADLLEKIKVQPDQNIPPYALIPGCRINPSIFGDLVALCETLKLTPPLYVEMPLDPMEVDPPLFTFKCQIGQLVHTGYASIIFYFYYMLHVRVHVSRG